MENHLSLDEYIAQLELEARARRRLALTRPRIWRVVPASERLGPDVRPRSPELRENTCSKTLKSRRKPKLPKVANGDGFEPVKAELAYMGHDPCAYCAGPSDSWDHIDSRKRGGKHRDNLVRACIACNMEKSSRTLLMFLVLRSQRKRAGSWQPRKSHRLVGGAKPKH